MRRALARGEVLEVSENYPWMGWLRKQVVIRRKAEDEALRALDGLHHQEALDVLSRVGMFVREAQFKDPSNERRA